MGGVRIGGRAIVAVEPFVPYWRFTDLDDGLGSFQTELLRVPRVGGTATVLRTIANDVFSFPLASPDFTKIVYVEGNVLSENLRIMNANGTGDVAFGTGGHETHWHPDGSEVVFIRSGTGIVRRTLAGAETVVGGTGNASRPQFSPDGTKIAYWDLNSDDVRVIDPDGTNDTLLDSDPPTTNQRQRLSYAHNAAMIAYGESVSGEDYWRILDDGTGKTQCNPAGFNTGSNPIVTHTCWEPDDAWFVGSKFAGSTLGWQIHKLFADGVTAPTAMGLYHSGDTGSQPYVFGDRIYWVDWTVPEPNDVDGAPLVSVALDGTDYRVEDDANGGDPLVTLGME